MSVKNKINGSKIPSQDCVVPFWDCQARFGRIDRCLRVLKTQLFSVLRKHPRDQDLPFLDLRERVSRVIPMVAVVVTLHDANMLCSVTQTADTLNTGDHSVPRMEAQIYDRLEIEIRVVCGLNSHAHWSTRAEIESEIITALVRTRLTYWVYGRLLVLVYDELDRWGGDGVVCVEAEH